MFRPAVIACVALGTALARQPQGPIRRFDHEILPDNDLVYEYDYTEIHFDPNVDDEPPQDPKVVELGPGSSGRETAESHTLKPGFFMPELPDASSGGLHGAERREPTLPNLDGPPGLPAMKGARQDPITNRS